MPSIELKVKDSQVKKFVRSVRYKYREANLPGVFGIPRGGLIPAVMISHALNIPLLMAPVEGCLIVDDICDSGESLIHYVKDSSGTGKKKYHIATIYYKEGAVVTPDLFLYTKKDNTWLVFPWEI